MHLLIFVLGVILVVTAFAAYVIRKAYQALDKVLLFLQELNRFDGNIEEDGVEEEEEVVLN